MLPHRVRSLDAALRYDRQGRLAYRDANLALYELLKQRWEKLL